MPVLEMTKKAAVTATSRHEPEVNEFDRLMEEDLEYQDMVLRKLARGRADATAGRVISGEEMKRRQEARKRKYGIL